MPRTKLVFYSENDGQVPVLDWLDSLPPKALNKCRVSSKDWRNLAMSFVDQKPTFCAKGYMNCALDYIT